ncbi:MAG: hypothetical protein H6608_01425 [Flavobacteriales bacterium]|nr:hypothetical protein [Bacteroidota bacterium]MCB9239767.1 hypothetical protein [Flavobacteriales bacterium]
MKRVLSIVILSVVLFNLMGFQFSLEHCCSDKLVLTVGQDAHCYDGCCGDEMDGDCCDLQYFSKDAGGQLPGLLTQYKFHIPVANIPAGYSYQSFTQVVQTFALKTVDFPGPPTFLSVCVFRC